MASAATAKELTATTGKWKDGSKSVTPDKRVIRTKMKCSYAKPEYIPNEADMIDHIFEEYGRVLYKKKNSLPPRHDITQYDNSKHDKEFTNTIQWGQCPEEHQEDIISILREYWDVFAQEGMKKPMHGFFFNINTGVSYPVSCKPPRYGTHESRIILKVVEGLKRDGIIKDNDGPWGALVMLAAKPNQEHKYWAEYIWRLCISYWKLNAITRPFNASEVIASQHYALKKKQSLLRFLFLPCKVLHT